MLVRTRRRLEQVRQEFRQPILLLKIAEYQNQHREQTEDFHFQSNRFIFKEDFFSLFYFDEIGRFVSLF